MLQWVINSEMGKSTTVRLSITTMQELSTMQEQKIKGSQTQLRLYLEHRNKDDQQQHQHQTVSETHDDHIEIVKDIENSCIKRRSSDNPEWWQKRLHHHRLNLIQQKDRSCEFLWICPWWYGMLHLISAERCSRQAEMDTQG